MRYDNIKKWFEIVIACSGSGSLIQMKQALAEAGASVASQYIDDPEYADQAKAWKPSDDSIYYEAFADDFDQLYRPEIISMVNWCVLSDVAAFYQLFDSFKDDTVNAFNSSDDSTNKQRLADRIAQQLYIVKAAANRLADTLKEKWGVLNDPRQNHAILNQRDNNSHSSFVLLIAIIQNQLQQKQSAGQQPAANGPFNLDRYKKPDQDYFYLALLLAQKTEDYLTNGGWFELYCSESVLENYVKNLYSQSTQSTNADLQISKDNTLSNKSFNSSINEENTELSQSSKAGDWPKRLFLGDKVRQATLALCYYYCHNSGELKPFQAGIREQEYEDVANEYNLSGKRFQLHYNKFAKTAARLESSNIKYLRDAIHLLAKYPKAKEQAETELRIAKTRNPVT